VTTKSELLIRSYLIINETTRCLKSASFFQVKVGKNKILGSECIFEKNLGFVLTDTNENIMVYFEKAHTLTHSHCEKPSKIEA
jgi:hypothetical protein